eukprot:scaffold48926_cov32-Tisochrysis_lutea.AAC.1
MAETPRALPLRLQFPSEGSVGHPQPSVSVSQSCLLEPTFYFSKWGSMGPSRPPHSVADTPRGGP